MKNKNTNSNIKPSLYPQQRLSIYEKELSTINDMSFSIREIDVICCVLHNRTAKAIGEILSISYKTVSAHLYNIYGKIDNRGKDAIINFCEKSGKLQSCKLYYFCLKADLIFRQSLSKLSASHGNKVVHCLFNFNKNSSKTLKIIEQLSKYLRLINIIPNKKISSHDIEYSYQIVCDDVFLNSPVNQVDKNIILFFNCKKDLIESNQNYVFFDQEEQYYFSFFLLLEKMSFNPDIKKVAQEFRLELDKLQQALNFNTEVETSSKQVFLTKKNIIIVTLVFIIFSTFVFSTRYYKNISAQKTYEEKLKELVISYSSDNYSSKERLQKNYELNKEVEKLIDSLDYQKIHNQIIDQKLNKETLLNLTYCLHSLGSYYVYNKIDGIKARGILFFAKEIIESYIKTKNIPDLDFTKLSNNEKLAELSIVEDLPYLYTRIIHTIGKTYIYDDNLEEATKCFLFSNEIGKKIGIFEGVLSSRDGLQLIKRVAIESLIENGDNDQAIKKINEAIKELSILRNNGKKYIINYRPNNLLAEWIIPKKDPVHMVSVQERMANYYVKLIKLTMQESLKKEYFKQIEDLYLDNHEEGGIILQSKSVIQKKLASTYSNLGFILLGLMDENINTKYFKESIARELGIVFKNSTQLIEEIFTLSRSISRNTDEAKADVYHGLFILYNMILKQEKAQENNSKLVNKIKEYEKERDILNQQLGRKGWRLKFYPSFTF